MGKKTNTVKLIAKKTTTIIKTKPKARPVKATTKPLKKNQRPSSPSNITKKKSSNIKAKSNKSSNKAKAGSDKDSGNKKSCSTPTKEGEYKSGSSASKAKDKEESPASAKSLSKKNKNIDKNKVVVYEEPRSASGGDSKSKSKHDSNAENIIKKSTKQQFSGRVDTKTISNEVTRMIEDIEKKKGSKSDSKVKKERVHEKKFTAKEFNYKLTKNLKMKDHAPFINLFELSKKLEFTNTDILLAIIEIGVNHEYYSIPYSTKSTLFWEEIVQFDELKRLFQFLRPETIKKYYRLISYKNKSEDAAQIIKDNKKLLDSKKTKLLTIITGLQNYLNKKIKSFVDFINNHYKYLDIGIPSELESNKLLGKKRTNQQKVFKGNNMTEEIKKFLVKDGANSKSYLLEKNDIKRLTYGLKAINNKENRKLFRFTEEDKFIFKCFEDVVNVISKEFKDVPKEYIINAMKLNTLNIPQLYDYLKNPHLSLNEKAVFNSADDHVIKYMKNTTFYKELIDSHGINCVDDREYFLSN